MALNQAEKEAKVVEITEKEIEIAAHDAVTSDGVADIRVDYNFQAMQDEISDYLATRTTEKATLASELQTLKDELIAP